MYDHMTLYHTFICTKTKQLHPIILFRIYIYIYMGSMVACPLALFIFSTALLEVDLIISFPKTVSVGTWNALSST